MGIDIFNPPPYVVCKIDNYSDIHSQIPKLRSFIFRGHRCASWPLRSSLDREFKKYPQSQMMMGAEKCSLEYFKKRAHLYSAQIPNPNSDIDLLVLMQHYGCPTRLVDFTGSFNIASYFAVRDSSKANEEFCVWALNYNALKEHSDGVLGTKNIHKRIHEIIFEVLDFKENGIILIEPKIVTKRMSFQQGLLLAQANIWTSFENNLLSAMSTKNDPININLNELTEINQNIINNIKIIKFTFNEKYIQQVRRYLFNSNITSESLFPDLEGLVRTAVEHAFWRY